MATSNKLIPSMGNVSANPPTSPPTNDETATWWSSAPPAALGDRSRRHQLYIKVTISIVVCVIDKARQINACINITMNAFCSDRSLIDISIQLFSSLVLKINQRITIISAASTCLEQTHRATSKSKCMHAGSSSKEPSTVLIYELQGKVSCTDLGHNGT